MKYKTWLVIIAVGIYVSYNADPKVTNEVVAGATILVFALAGAAVNYLWVTEVNKPL